MIKKFEGFSKLPAEDLEKIKSALFYKLKKARRLLAKGSELWFVCKNESLVEMVDKLPRNRDDMKNIKGMTENKIEKFGDGFLKAINEFLMNLENDGIPEAYSGNVDYSNIVKLSIKKVDKINNEEENKIYLSDKVFNDGIFTTYGHKTYELNYNSYHVKTSRNISCISDKKLEKLDEHGVIKLNEIVEYKDVLVGLLKTKQNLTPEERLLQAIFGEDEIKENVSVYYDCKRAGVVKSIERLPKGKITKIVVDITIPVDEGDVLSDTNGNKGTIYRLTENLDKEYDAIANFDVGEFVYVKFSSGIKNQNNL